MMSHIDLKNCSPNLNEAIILEISILKKRQHIINVIIKQPQKFNMDRI